LNMRPLATANYNLSQVSREMLDFAQGQEYFKAALKLDRSAVAAYRSISGRSPNRLVADETLSSAEICNYSGERRYPSYAMGLSNVPLMVISAVALLLSAAFYLINIYFRQRAYRCRKCNIILCPACEKYSAWGHMCAQCYGSLVKLDELDARERVSRIFAIHERQTRRRNIMRILSFTVPGAAQIYAGRILQGFLFMLPFLFFIFVSIAIDSSAYGYPQISNMLYKSAAAFIAAALYIVFNVITGQRISKGWL
jgi:TM2 domain-containing membrane protein YozV